MIGGEENSRLAGGKFENYPEIKYMDIHCCYKGKLRKHYNKNSPLLVRL
jgi:hypothetical protein